jgi:hypothetical protein
MSKIPDLSDTNSKSLNFSNLPKKIIDFWTILNIKLQPVKSFLGNHRAVILGGLLAMTSVFYFTSVAYIEQLNQVFGQITIRQAGVFSVVLVLSFSLFGSWFGSKSWLNFGFIWLQSLFLSFFAFSYFLSIENRDFYPILFAILPVLIFLVNTDLFGEQKYYHFTTFSQVLLYALQTFSLLNFFNIDRISTREFQENILAQIFSLDPIFWLILSTLAITFVSLGYFKILSTAKSFTFGSILFLTLGQVLWLAEVFDFNQALYWQKTLLFVIVWDFLIPPLQSIILGKIDEKYNPRIIISTAYHGFLVLVVTIFSII